MSTKTCENCDFTCQQDDVFCENCGYDFLTGSLPDPDLDPSSVGTGEVPSAEAPAPVAPSVLESEDSEGEAPAPAPAIRLRVEASREYFGDVVSDGEVDFPDPAPAPQELELAGYELHIGRTSDSRAIHPDLDLALLTGDKAVSSRHAVIRVSDEGEGTIADIGSTNGTLVGELDSDPLIEGVPVAFDVGAEAYFGAWTKVTRLP